MSYELMPANNLDDFTAAPHHPMAPNGYPLAFKVDEVGRQLQDYRLSSGLTQLNLASELDWSASKVMRIEAGQVRPTVTDVRALLAVHGVHDKDETDTLLRTVRDNRSTYKTGPYTGSIPPKFEHYLSYEAAATRACFYTDTVVPDILQTSAYAAKVDEIFHPDQDADGMEQLMYLRRERAAYLLGKWGPPLHIIIDEAVLNRPERGAGPDGKGKQYEQLRLVISSLKRLNTAGQERAVNSELNQRITVQVAPYSASVYPLADRSYNVVDTGGQRPAVYVEGPSDDTSMFDTSSVKAAAYRSNFDLLAAGVPSPERTNSLLDAILASLPS